jgi:hypothetical protein
MTRGTITPEEVERALEGELVQLSLPNFSSATLWATRLRVRLTVTKEQGTLISEVTQGDGSATPATQ